MNAPRKSADVLADAARAAELGNVFFTNHAEKRMDERNATTRDVLKALATATNAKYQPERDTWKVTGGSDLDGDDLDVVICTPRPGVVVVTVF